MFGHSNLFEPAALAAVLTDGRIDACVIDGAEPDFLGPASPLHGIKNLTVTPRLGSHTHEARLRSSWYVAHRLHDAVLPASASGMASAGASVLAGNSFFPGDPVACAHGAVCEAPPALGLGVSAHSSAL